MRLTDDRYANERSQFELALRMIRHEARTRTIRECTGLSDDRIRKLYSTYFGAHRGAAAAWQVAASDHPLRKERGPPATVHDARRALQRRAPVAHRRTEPDSPVLAAARRGVRSPPVPRLRDLPVTARAATSELRVGMDAPAQHLRR